MLPQPQSTRSNRISELSPKLGVWPGTSKVANKRVIAHWVTKHNSSFLFHSLPNRSKIYVESIKWRKNKFQSKFVHAFQNFIHIKQYFLQCNCSSAFCVLQYVDNFNDCFALTTTANIQPVNDQMFAMALAATCPVELTAPKVFYQSVIIYAYRIESTECMAEYWGLLRFKPQNIWSYNKLWLSTPYSIGSQ